MKLWIRRLCPSLMLWSKWLTARPVLFRLKLHSLFWKGLERRNHHHLVGFSRPVLGEEVVTHGIQISQQGEGMSHTRYLLAVMKALAVLLVSIIIRASISIHLERDLTDDYKGLFFFFFKKKSRIRPSINETQNLKTGFTNWVGMNLRHSLRVPNTVVHASNWHSQ